SSIFYANKVVELSKLGYNPLIKLDALNLLANIYKSKHNTDSVAKYFDLIIAIKDGLFSQKKMIQLQSITFDEQRRQQEQSKQQDTGVGISYKIFKTCKINPAKFTSCNYHVGK